MTKPQRSSAESGGRVGYLDGLRGLAILAVIGYHYYSRFAHDLLQIYPYGKVLAEFVPFYYGFYGVHLFFAISGFVISLSLERSQSFGQFAIKRFARLWPTMLLCSVLTYAVLAIWPRFWPQSWKNFIPSLTFIDGQVWNRLTPLVSAQWIDGAYWSLFVEVRFYALAAFIYFFNRKKFFIYLSIFSGLAVAAHVALRLAGELYFADFLQQAFCVSYLPWFMVGVSAFLYERGQLPNVFRLISAAAFSLFLLVMVGESKGSIIAFLFVVFLLFSKKNFPAICGAISHPCLVKVGVASYSRYLLHQNAGLTIISVISEIIGLNGTAALVVPVLVGAAIVGLSQVIFRYWEVPINRLIVDRYARGGN